MWSTYLALDKKWFLFRKMWLRVFPYSRHFGQTTCHSKGPAVPSNSCWFLEVPMNDNDSPQNQVFPWRAATNYFPTMHTMFNRKIRLHLLFPLYKDCAESAEYVLFLLGMPYLGPWSLCTPSICYFSSVPGQRWPAIRMVYFDEEIRILKLADLSFYDLTCLVLWFRLH